MTGGNAFDAREDRLELAAAIEELRSLLRSFGDVAPAEMDERFYIHAYNELDLAGRSVVEALDRYCDSRGARCEVVVVPRRSRRSTLGLRSVNTGNGDPKLAAEQRARAC